MQEWKNRSGYNDDWKLSTAWVQSLGGKFGYEEVKRKFVELYWGENGAGNVAREKWLLPEAMLRRLAKEVATCSIYRAGPGKSSITHLELCRVRKFFGES